MAEAETTEKSVRSPSPPPPQQSQQRSATDPHVSESGPGGGNAFTLWFASIADTFTRWGTSVEKRDRELRDFWPTESHLASAVYTVSISNAALDWEIEAPPRTQNAIHELMTTANMGKGFGDLLRKISIDFYCLAGPTRISLGGDRRGQTKSIAAIVRDKDPGPVLSVDEHGRIVERQINEWHKTPLGDREWWWISSRNSQHAGKRRGGVFVTEDHPFLTGQGWLQAKDIKAGMNIATADPELSRRQRELLVGTLLGDASLGFVGKRSMLRMTHAEDQKDWLDLKMRAFEGLEWTGQNRSPSREMDGYTTQPIHGVNSKVTRGLNEMRDAWYPNGHKIAPTDLVSEHFSPLMLAAWYCDDGSLGRAFSSNGHETRPNAYISSQSFTLEENKQLARVLAENGISAEVKTDQNDRPRLWMGADAAESLFGLIGPYVPPCLRHKLPEQAPEYDPSLWDLEPATVAFDEVVESRQRDYRSGHSVVQTTYHIGVEETRNFIAAGLVSHNTQDNGAFFEIIRVADNPGAPIIGLNHLDSGQCVRTGDIEVPVIYTDEKGRRHKMKWYQAVPLEEFPSPIQSMHGVGYCAITRCLRTAQIMRDIMIYRGEKVAGRNSEAINIVGGVSQSAIEDVRERMQETADNEGRIRHMEPLILAGLDPQAAPSVATILMKALPESFDFDQEMRWYIASLALAFGRDYQEFAPLPAGNLGTSQQSYIQHLKSRGKGPATFIEVMEHALNNFVMPSSATFRFQDQDIDLEERQADIKKTRAEARAKRIDSGEVTPEIARQIANDEGDLDTKYIVALGERDITPDTTIEGGENPEAELEADEVSEIDTEDAEKAINLLDRARQGVAQILSPFGRGERTD